jgi:GYF domain 2
MGFGMGNQMAGMYNQNQFNPHQGTMNQGPQGPPPPPPLTQYFIAVNGQQQGPFDEASFRGMIQSGSVNKDTMVWKNGMIAWTAAGQVAELASLFMNTPPPPPAG